MSAFISYASASLLADLVFQSLKNKSDDRRQLLDDSLEAQQYFADANEAESWMREKEPIVGLADFGKDEDTTEAMLKKHDALMADILAYQSTIDALRDQAKACNLQVGASFFLTFSLS